MNIFITIFYLIGLLYLICSIIFFCYDFNKNKDAILNGNLDTYTTVKAMLANDSGGNVFNKTFPKWILVVIFLLWTFTGYNLNFPEKQFFLYNLIVLVFNMLFIAFLTMRMGYLMVVNDELNDDKTKPKPSSNRKEIVIPYTRIIYFLEIVFVAIILIKHYVLIK